MNRANIVALIFTVGLVGTASFWMAKKRSDSLTVCESRLKELSYKIESAAMPSNGIYPPTMSQVKTALYGAASSKELDPLLECPIGSEYAYSTSPNGSSFTLCCTSDHGLSRSGFPQYSAERGLLKP